MSAICLVATFDGAEVERRAVDAMSAAAAHRAVDGVRTWTGPGCGAAYLALDVTAEDHSDAQPLVQGPLVCLADARLDDRGLLQQSLVDAGCLDRGDHSDSQLLLAAYRLWGASCVDHLLGDFAFAVWHARSRRLFAARDAMGARSLYYRVEPGRRVLLATEIKQLLAAPGVPKDLNEGTVLADVAGLSMPLHATHYAGIHSLAPAHALTVSRADHRTWRYWTLEVGGRLRYRDTGLYAEHLQHVLSASVRDRLRTDRPAGLLLSGGVDSTAVAATAACDLGRGEVTASLRAFSWAFDDVREMDERHLSGPLAEHLRLPVTDIPADDAWPLSGLSRHGPDQDDPYIWLFQTAFDRTAAMARSKGLRVLLTSDRGDQMTGGWAYDDLGLLRAGRLRMLLHDARAYPESTGRPVRAYAKQRLVMPLATALWPPHVGLGVRAAARRWAGASEHSLFPWVPRSAAVRLQLRDLLETAVTLPRTRDVGRLHRHVSIMDPLSFRLGQLRQRTFARHALQHADPWNDRRLAELICSMPQWVVQRHSKHKAITHAAVLPLLPEQSRRRPPPVDTSRLIARGLVQREVETVRALMTDSRAQAAGLLDATALLRVYESDVAQGRLPLDLWGPLTVEIWLRRYWE